MTPAQLAERAERVLGAIGAVVVGRTAALRLVMMGLLTEGHVLIEDLPGLAKTLIARSFAQAAGIAFSRVQFTPDLLPSDVTGASVYDQRTGELVFRPGPVFANLVLGDEINRAPPKTQAALLEAMQERQVTVDGHTHPLERPFLVLATQNPIEFEGTYPLPEAQLDRFLLRTAVGYPERDEELQVLRRRIARAADEATVAPAITREELTGMQRGVEAVHVDDSLGYYMVDLVAATRSHPKVQVGASPRGGLALLKLARANAALEGRDYAVPDDVKAVAVPALAHRIALRPEFWVQRVRSEEIVTDCLASVPTPPPRDPRT